MNATELWQRYQKWLYFQEGLGFYLDVSRMRFDDALIKELQPKFDKAFADMAELEKGAIANPDENRMVGHYWLRNAKLAPTPELEEDIIKTIEQIEVFAEKIHTGAIHPPKAPRFTDVISIGIGGSALGPEFVAEALAPDFPNLAIHFIDNSDPAGIDRIMTQLRNRLASTMVIIISKSGGTPEPRIGMIEVKKVYAGQNLDFANYAIAITMPGSQLDELAKSENWLARFPMYDWVGGRTSELSAVGLVPAALQGIDIRAMLEGAKEMDEATRVADLKKNPAALLALSWYFAGNGKGEKDMVVLPYKDSLLLFSRYLQQLVMESLGKEKDLDGNVVHQGIAVYGNKGSTDQHAYVQQLRDGVANFFVTFIEVLEDRKTSSPEIEPGITSGDYLSGFIQGTRQALYENHRDSVTVTIPQVNPRTVGALIALYDRTVGFYGNLVNVNAYHQPGVEAGKKAAAVIIDLQKRVIEVLQKEKIALSLEAIAQKAGASDQIEAIYKIVRHLHTNQRGIVVQGNFGEPSSLTISAS
ncbi:MAG: glucose-6-phosphate isomerase [Rhizonema sp. NSF051]|nr:glucose-6-phosphate isomerase [Rhizonema sp. NSF051]